MNTLIRPQIACSLSGLQEGDLLEGEGRGRAFIENITL